MRKKSESNGTDLFGERLPLERELIASGIALVCGVDEAGRGPLAGPVVAAAMLFRDCNLLWKARDSKALSVKAREEFAARAAEELVFAIGQCSPQEIDEINILRASLLAMERAVAALPSQPETILVDGNQRLNLAIPSHAIVQGDARVAVISAASIIAKVTRDQIMHKYDAQYPGYGFAKHFGYPTEEHRRCLRNLGPCPIHRRTFQGVREFFEVAPTPES